MRLWALRIASTDLRWLSSSGTGLGDYQWDNSATDGTDYGRQHVEDPTQWLRGALFFEGQCGTSAVGRHGVNVGPALRSRTAKCTAKKPIEAGYMSIPT